MTSDSAKPILPLWPFLLADVLFIGLAVWLLQSAHRPILAWEAGGLILCVAGGTWSLITPFLRRYAAEQSLHQTESLAATIGQIQKLETVATQISHATSQWQGVQEHATSTANIAKELAESMAAEARSFTEFMGKADQTEKNHLRLEADKLRRAEHEWLQVTTRILDHIFALSQAADRSGQANLAQQITQFQDGCRDAARRVGLLPVITQPGEVFDVKVHQLADESTPPENSVVAEILATGYAYQGQLIRRSMVTVQPAS